MVKRVIWVLFSIAVLGAIVAFVHIEMIQQAVGTAIIGIFVGFLYSKRGEAALVSLVEKHPTARVPLAFAMVVVALTGFFLIITSFPY